MNRVVAHTQLASPHNLFSSHRSPNGQKISADWEAESPPVREIVVVKDLALILLAVVVGTSGQLTLKIGMGQVGRIGDVAIARLPALVAQVALNPLVVVGLGLYVLGAVVWLVVLSRIPLSLAQPVLALMYVLTPIMAWLLLGESLPITRCLGIATIVAGVALVAWA